MGYSVLYRYYERLPNGDYNREDIKEMKRKVGDPLDDTTLEELASKVLAQMARRDIFVQDVEIFEYEKKKIIFKETTGGIVLKNKKFTLDTIGHSLESKEISKENTPGQSIHPHHKENTLVQKSNGSGILVPEELQNQVPIRVEVYDPEQDMLKAGLIKGRFTPGKKYPIFSELKDPREATAGKELPILYVTIDDSGRRINAPSVAFRPIQVGLIGGNFSDNKPARGDGLIWDGVSSENIQDIRSLR